VVLEGDEYDTAFFDKRSKFVHYLPEVLLINNIEFDHADIFGSLDDVLLSFRRLVNIVPSNGLIVANGDDANVRAASSQAFTPVTTFGLGEGCDVRADDIEYESGTSMFTVIADGRDEGRVTLPLLGEYNVRNALGVWTIGRHLGIDADAIAKALSGYRNVKRRLELIGEWDDILLYDDFAHHPTAVGETLKAVRQLYPERRIRAIFEPRSNTTRRRVFQNELAEAFGAADDVILAQVDRLDELAPDERLDPDQLASDIASGGRTARFLPDVDAILDHVGSSLEKGDVIVVMSNGGFGGIVRRLSRLLHNNHNQNG
jgi:UDP-N-acetylmuramate: L-alanyl-gamma-D-glutamyl-meso-diaminopimelate ligase